MSSKQAILQQVRQNEPSTTELPSLEEDWICFDDPCAQFMEMVQQVVVHNLHQAYDRLTDQDSILLYVSTPKLSFNAADIVLFGLVADGL
jgi:hypothetical protein